MDGQKIGVKHDCFAYKKTNGRESCAALKELYCRYEECGFYKAKMGEEDQGDGN